MTEAALALTLAVDGERVDVYFEFEEDLADDRLGRLLALIGSCVTVFGSVPDVGGYGSQSETVLMTGGKELRTTL